VIPLSIKGKEKLNHKIITTILLILLLTNTAAAILYSAPVFAKVFTEPPYADTVREELMKGVDFTKTTPTGTDSFPSKPKDLLDFSQEKQNTNLFTYETAGSTELIVGLSETWNAYEKVEQLVLAKNGRIVNKILMENKISAVVIDVPPEYRAAFTTEIKESRLGRYVEPNLQYQTFMVPNDTFWKNQWGPAKIRADYAWNTTIGSSAVIVAVIDTGVDYNHPDLAANYVPLGYDWVNNDRDPIDDMGHGTHVAGIIGAVINNAQGIAGLAQVSIMSEKGLDSYGSGYYDDLSNAIINATDAGADIISMSWGGSTSSSVLHDALKYAYEKGVLLVAAAGNSGSTAKHYPAAYDEVVAVTATNEVDQPAWFTTYGDWVELSAPGDYIISTISSIHDPRFSYPYDYLSGTSMATPHVSGVAALVWSLFPTMSRDVLRFHLRDTADDLGAAGFDVFYGYGRINAQRAVEQPLPPHDLVITGWKRPPYIEPGGTGMVNVTVVNYGRNNETTTVQLLVNGSVEQSVALSDFLSGTSTEVSLSWSPIGIGNYNATVYVLPVVDETDTGNNVVQGFVYVDFPLKVFVLRSAGTQVITEAWNILNYNWKRFGNQLINVDYTTLDKDDITYDDLSATGADVLVVSCAYDWEYSDAEIEAIKQYVYEGHGFIVTAGTFYYLVPNNNKFGSILGLNESMLFDVTATDMMTLLDPSHSVFTSVPNPYTMSIIQTSVPLDGEWSSNELTDATYIAMGYYNESAITVYRGLVFISPWLEAIPERYHYNLQILYNAMTWSRYQKPEHELRVSVEAPRYLFPGDTVLVNATVRNDGLLNESNMDLYFSIYDTTRNQSVVSLRQIIPSLDAGASYTLNYIWNPLVKGVYNMTAYSPPLLGEESTANNKATVLVTVAPPLIKPQEGQWASYSAYIVDSTGQLVLLGKLGFNYSRYISPYLLNVTLGSIIYSPDGNNATEWVLVNIMNRICEDGAWMWRGYWFPGLIETNVTIGSQVNVLYGPATVIGSETLIVGKKAVDTWILYQNISGIAYTWWFDKTTGLWIRYEVVWSSNHQIIVLDGTNIPTGYTPEHELHVALAAPTFVGFGNSATLNATVSNFGLNNETDVELALEINGTIVLSLPIAKLAINETQSLSLLWTPPSEGTYNVTAYSPPVTSENVTLDNIATIMINVRSVKGYVLFDQTHGTDIIYNYNTWIRNVRDMGYVVDSHTAGPITSDVLDGYDAFVTVRALTMYTSDELSAIRMFVVNGGGLLVVGDSNPSVYTSLTSFAGISWVFGGVYGYTTNITPHEVTQGVNQVFFSGPAAMLTLSGSAQALVRDTYMEIMLAVNWYGRGRVLAFADQDALRDYSIGVADNRRLATNMIAWICTEDTTPPVISYMSPPNGTIVGTNVVQMQWVATDSQSGIGKYSVYLNRQFITNTSLQSYTLSNLIGGPNNVTIVAYDKAGNNAGRQVTIVVDLTSPEVAILSPANNSHVKQVVSINVFGSDDNLDRMELLIDSNLVATFMPSGTHTYLWNTTAEQYAVHQITLIGYDTVGNNASMMIAVTVDNIPPTVNITSPSNNAYASGSLTFVFFAQDFALKNASLMIGDSVIIDVTGKTSQLFNTTAISDGDYIVKLIAYDWAENKAEASITLTIDNTKPSAQITSPTANSHVKGVVNVAIAFNDTNLQSATLTIAGQPLNVTAPTVIAWSTAGYGDGRYTLALAVLDKAGNEKTHQIFVTVDNTPPVGELRTPLNGAYVKGTINVTFYVYDANLNITKLYINGGVDPTTWNTPGTHNRLWDTTASTDQTYTLRLEIYDKAGNQLVTTATVIVDNTMPTVSISSPAGNATVSGNVTITFAATDSNLADVVLFIDSASHTVGSQTPYQWDTTKLVDGDHTIKIVATDWAGNTKETTMTVKTSNAFPPYVWPAAAGVLGLAIGALIVWFVLKKKPSSKPASTVTTPPPA